MSATSSTKRPREKKASSRNARVAIAQKGSRAVARHVRVGRVLQNRRKQTTHTHTQRRSHKALLHELDVINGGIKAFDKALAHLSTSGPPLFLVLHFHSRTTVDKLLNFSLLFLFCFFFFFLSVLLSFSQALHARVPQPAAVTSMDLSLHHWPDTAGGVGSSHAGLPQDTPKGYLDSTLEANLATALCVCGSISIVSCIWVLFVVVIHRLHRMQSNRFLLHTTVANLLFVSPPQKKISSANKPCPLILFCLQTMFMLVSLSLLLFVPMPHTHTHIPHTTHTHHTPHTKLKYSLTHTLCDRYTVYWVLPRFPSLNLVTERYGGAVCRCTEGLRAYTYRDSRCSLNPTTEAATL